MLLEDDEKIETMGLEEDEQVKVLNELTDSEEIQAAKELINEDIEKLEKGEPLEDNSQKGPEVSDKPKEFLVTQEFINSQPEENRALFETFLGKNKEDLAKAAANAIAVKNIYIKDNEQAINAIAEKIKAETDENLVKVFIESKREVGRTEKPPETIKEEPHKIELPELENTPEVKAAIQKETIKKLKEKYPGMPEDVNSVEHKEWLRDLQDEDLQKAIDYTNDVKQTQNEVKEDMQKVVYLKNNWSKINNERIEAEVNGIKDSLKKLGITDKDLGVDLTLTKNEKSGLLENPILNDLAFNGNVPDPYIVGYIGNLAFYRNEKDKGGNTPMVKKFLYENNFKILTLLNNREAQLTKKEIERVKETNLNTLHETPSGGKTPEFLSPEKIAEITDPAILQREKDKILNSV